MKPVNGRPSNGHPSSDWVGTVASLWGNWAPNRWADQAGRHRRLAVGSAALAIPFLVMAAAPAATFSDRLFSAAHVMAAACFLWLARDLTRSASLVGATRLPHISSAALVVSLWVLYRHRTDQFEMIAEAQPLLLPGLAFVGVAIAVLTLVDRLPRTGPQGGLLGRLLLVASAAPVGVAAIVGGLIGPPFGIYSAGVGLAGVLLVAMALFEGRLLWRAAALLLQLRSS